MAQYKGVDLDRVKPYVDTMVKNGKKVADIVKVVGIPHEAVKSINKDAKD